MGKRHARKPTGAGHGLGGVMRQHGARLADRPREKPFIVRPAVRKGPRQRTKRRGVDLATIEPDYAADTAHR